MNDITIIQKPESEPEISQPEHIIYQHETGYYRILHDHEVESNRDEGFKAGALVYVYVGKNAYHVFVREDSYTYKFDKPEDMHEFKNDFEFVPNGAELRQKQINGIMEEIAENDVQVNLMQKQMTNFQPHVANTGELSTSTALVPKGTSMEIAKKTVAECRNTALKVQKDLNLKTKELQMLVSEQSRALAIKVKEMGEMMSQMEEAIWTINLYLGKNEEIHILRKGTPAPVEEKIVIRQNVLFMDEESALFARNDGMDVQNIEDFDRWLMENEKHLTQILPDQKGIVALRIRRTGKKYEDPWKSIQLNNANLTYTYFLIKNGENLYRVYVDIVAGKYLFPRIADFEDLLWTYETDKNDPEHPSVRVPLKPGSKAYMRAMESAEETRKDCLRVILVLQGLMDRTPIFKPMPVSQINLCDPKHCMEWLTLIYESENIITDGRPTFHEWQKTINDQIDVGHRIIGLFDYTAELRGRQYETGRIYPRTADYPDSMILHTIEELEDATKYVFRYQRTGETVYSPRKSDGWNYPRGHTPEVRARCYVRKNDKFMIDFDAATLEEFTYYQTHRQSRKEYKDMIPLLEVAVEIKKREECEEAPFRQLLIGQIMQRYGTSQDAATAKIDELIKWWKFKNRTHRALVSDDQKALTMIVDEYGLRQKQESVRQQSQGIKDTIITVIGSQEPAPIMIAHKSDNKYVAYIPHNNQNVWVTEQTWTHNRQTNDIKLKELKEWKLVDKRHIRWEIIYKIERWDNWKINPMMSTVLTDLEISKIVEEAYERLNLPPKNVDPDDDKVCGRFLPLCAHYNDDYQITLWHSDMRPIIPNKEIINSSITEPKVCRNKLSWTRTKDGVILNKYLHADHYCYNPSKPPWETDYSGYKVNAQIIRKWDENIAQIAKEFEQVREAEKVRRQLAKRFDYVSDLVSDIVYDAKIAKARAEFDADYGDPELWEDHLESLKITRLSPSFLHEAINLLVERAIDPVGMTLKEVYIKAVKLGLLKERSWHNRGPKKIPRYLPFDFVIPPPPVTKEEIDDED